MTRVHRYVCTIWILTTFIYIRYSWGMIWNDGRRTQRLPISKQRPSLATNRSPLVDHCWRGSLGLHVSAITPPPLNACMLPSRAYIYRYIVRSHPYVCFFLMCMRSVWLHIAISQIKQSLALHLPHMTRRRVCLVHRASLDWLQSLRCYQGFSMCLHPSMIQWHRRHRTSYIDLANE